MKNEFVLAFNEVLEEKQLPKDVILEALEAAIKQINRELRKKQEEFGIFAQPNE